MMCDPPRTRPASCPAKSRCWLAIVAAVAVVLSGCATSTDDDEARGESSEAISNATCEASKSEGAVSSFQKALHDTIAFAEGTRGKGAHDGYDVGFAYKNFKSCARHPNVKTCSGKLCSTASGRYQFLKRTWDGTVKGAKLTSFEPDQQELGARYLVTKVRKVTIPERTLTATEFSNAMKKLSYEWASLPPGRYGQPNRSEAALRRDYCVSLGC